jgi:hypothetical protein
VRKGRAAALPAILERVYEKKWAEEVVVGNTLSAGERSRVHIWGLACFGGDSLVEVLVKAHGLVAGLCELVAPFTTRYHCGQQCPKAIPGRGLLDWQFRGAWLHGF